MKKIFIFYCLFIFSSIILYSQNIERITYMDIGADGSQRVYRTVNAVFCGWAQQEWKREGNFRAVYSTFCLIDGEWSNWEIAERRPMQGTLSEMYDAFVRDYTLFPNAGGIIPFGDGINVLRMLSKPTGKPNPFWWNTDGKSFFVFYNLYIIVG